MSTKGIYASGDELDLLKFKIRKQIEYEEKRKYYDESWVKRLNRYLDLDILYLDDWFSDVFEQDSFIYWAGGRNINDYVDITLISKEVKIKLWNDTLKNPF